MIKVDIRGIETTLAVLRGQSRQIPFAANRALNEIAKKVVAKEKQALSTIFDRPTPRTLNAVKIFKGSKKDDLSVLIAVDDGAGRKNYKAMGKKGTVAPAQYLLTQIVGGQRAPKRFEKALQAIGAMEAGHYAIFAKRSNALDAYGNIPGAKINQMISYFRTTKAEGYGGKMSDARKQKMMRGELKGQKWGMAYFRGGRDTGLPDGIWERHYPNGMAGKSFIRPILIYVKSTRYRPRFRFREIAEETVAREWRREYKTALENALRTAK